MQNSSSFPTRDKTKERIDTGSGSQGRESLEIKAERNQGKAGSGVSGQAVTMEGVRKILDKNYNRETGGTVKESL